MRLICMPILAALGCGRSESKTRLEPVEPLPAPKPALADPCAKAKQHGAMKWIEDDFASALSCAKQTKKPIVLDLWAPWCHTCLSMQSEVFADKSFEAKADKFVYVALDTDREVNAAATAKYPPSGLPTFYVIGPDEAVLSRFIGAASVAQFHSFLETGEKAMAGGVAGADAHLMAASRHMQAKQFEDADRELTAALKDAPAEWPRRADALVTLINARNKQKKHAECVELAEASLDQTGVSASASDFLYQAMECAKERAKAEPDRVKKLRERAVARWEKLLADPAAALTIDDRSDAMANLRATFDDLGKPDVAKQIAEKQRLMLDEAAARAKSPMAAMTFNWPRAEVYVYLGRPLDLVPALEKSAADLPKEYDPRARLGWIYLKGDKLPEAAKWTDQALALSYGPRKTRVLALRAEIAAKANDKAGQRRYLEEIVKTLEKLPSTQTTPEAIAKAKQAVADLAPK